jgi:hypothetical protein
MTARIHFEARLDALGAFYKARMKAAPETEQAAIQSRLLAFHVAGTRPQRELPLILFMSRRPAAKEVLSRLCLLSRVARLGEIPGRAF